jgi:hypothetical protein
VTFDVSERYFESAGSAPAEGAAAASGPTDGAAVLRAALAFYERHLAASDEARVVLAVWAAHTHAIDAFGTTPYLHVTSPEPESGKSRVLELLELLCREPIRTSNISLAATFRAIHELKPTLLLDEVDNMLADRAARAELLGILNDGYRRGGSVFRVGGAKMATLERFGVFCPKAFAGLKELPGDALKSRCLRIEVKRRKPDEPGGGFVFEDEQEVAQALRDGLAGWIDGNLDELRGRRPERIEGVRDRTWESVRPLVVVADAAGGEWPGRLRAAVLALVAATANEVRSSGVQLLADVRRLFHESGRDAFTKAELLQALRALEEAPYAEWENFTTNRLSRTLKRYGVPGDAFIHDGAGKSHRGWKREHFAEPWERYIPIGQSNRANRADGLVEPVSSDQKACGGDAPHGLEDGPNLRGYAIRTDRTLSAPFPGDEGFRDCLNRALDADHLTVRERFERRLLHDLIWRARATA